MLSEDEDFHLDGDGNRWARRPIIVPSGPSIIVEGPDRVGKTTIVQRLSKMLHIPAFKCPSEKHIFKNGGRDSLIFDFTLTHFLHQTGYRFISDRGYPSEKVYSLVFERDTDDFMLRAIDRAHANIGTKILYLYSSEEPTEKDDLVPDGMYFRVKAAYDNILHMSDCRVYRYDTARMLQAYRDGGDISAEVAKDVAEAMGLVA